MATNPFEKFRTKIAEGLFALNTKLFADGEKVSGDNPLPMKQYGSIGVNVDADLIQDNLPANSTVEMMKIEKPTIIDFFQISSFAPLDDSSLRLKIKLIDGSGETQDIEFEPAGENNSLENWVKNGFLDPLDDLAGNVAYLRDSRAMRAPNGIIIEFENRTDSESEQVSLAYQARITD